MSFRFKQFTVDDSHCAMKVGTDGVLLGAWAMSSVPLAGQAAEPKRILDVGTGSGVVALMLAQRFRSANITAIDINAEAAAQAAVNFTASPWSERLSSRHLSLQQLTDLHGEGYDLIVSNPPYFTESLKAPDTNRATARHADSLPLEQLFRLSADMLKPTGRLSIITPAAHCNSLRRLAASNNLVTTTLCHVFSKEGKPELRVLSEFALASASGWTSSSEAGGFAIPIESTIFLQNSDGSRTVDYSRLTCDFYL